LYQGLDTKVRFVIVYWYKANRFEVVMTAFFVTMIRAAVDIGPDADILRVLGG
jgi:hypothetical protein